MASDYSAALRALSKAGYDGAARRAFIKESGGAQAAVRRLGGYGALEPGRDAKIADVTQRLASEKETATTTVLSTPTPIIVNKGATNQVTIIPSNIPKLDNHPNLPIRQTQTQPISVQSNDDRWGFRPEAQISQLQRQQAVSNTAQFVDYSGGIGRFMPIEEYTKPQDIKQKPFYQRTYNLQVPEQVSAELARTAQDSTVASKARHSQVPEYARQKEIPIPAQGYLINRTLEFAHSKDILNVKPTEPKLIYNTIYDATKEVGSNIGRSLKSTAQDIAAIYKLTPQSVMIDTLRALPSIARDPIWKGDKIEAASTYLKVGGLEYGKRIVEAAPGVLLVGTIGVGMAVPAIGVGVGSLYGMQLTRDIIEKPSSKNVAEGVIFGGFIASPYIGRSLKELITVDLRSQIMRAAFKTGRFLGETSEFLNDALKPPRGTVTVVKPGVKVAVLDDFVEPTSGRTYTPLYKLAEINERVIDTELWAVKDLIARQAFKAKRDIFFMVGVPEIKKLKLEGLNILSEGRKDFIATEKEARWLPDYVTEEDKRLGWEGRIQAIKDKPLVWEQRREDLLGDTAGRNLARKEVKSFDPFKILGEVEEGKVQAEKDKRRAEKEARWLPDYVTEEDKRLGWEGRIQAIKDKPIFEEIREEKRQQDILKLARVRFEKARRVFDINYVGAFDTLKLNLERARQQKQLSPEVQKQLIDEFYKKYVTFPNYSSKKKIYPPIFGPTEKPKKGNIINEERKDRGIETESGGGLKQILMPPETKKVITIKLRPPQPKRKLKSNSKEYIPYETTGVSEVEYIRLPALTARQALTQVSDWGISQHKEKMMPLSVLGFNKEKDVAHPLLTFFKIPKEDRTLTSFNSVLKSTTSQPSKDISSMAQMPKLAQITRDAQIQRVTQTSRVMQIPKLAQITRDAQIQRVTQTPITEQIQRVAQMPRIAQILRIRQIPKPPKELKKPIFGKPPPEYNNDEDKRRKKKKGYGVAFKRQGKFKVLGGKPLSMEAALSLGARKVGSTASATFKIFEKGEVSEMEQLPQDNYFKTVANRFYARDKPKEGRVFIQKRQFRISSPGEVKDITFAPRKTGGFKL